jgi:HSP20 family protein
MSFLQNFKKPSSLMSRVEEDPFYSLQTDINKLFGSLLSDSFTDKVVAKKVNWNPKVELKESAKEFLLTADLPGCDKNDVHISLHNDVLSLKGERKFQENKNDEKYHFSEKFYGSFERQIHMPENLVDKKKVDAKFENGVLTVTLAKKYEAQNEPKKIEIK